MATSALEKAMTALLFDTQADTIKASWDDTRVSIQSQPKTVRIPAEIEEHCAKAIAKTQVGLFPRIHHVWISVDDTLYIWDYTRTLSQPITIPASGIIRTVGLLIPKPDVFDPTVTFLVVIGTLENIILAGLEYTEVAPMGNIQAAPYCEITLKPLEGYHTSSEGIPFDKTRTTSKGRIFLSSSSSAHVYEVDYQKSDGFFRNKCRLINLTAGLWNTLKTATRLFSSCNVKLFEVISPYLVVCDQENGLHLYQVEHEGASTFSKLCSITARETEALIEQFFQHPQHTPHITHIFPCMSTGQALQCMCLTHSGERIHFTLSCNRKTGPGVHGHGTPEIFEGGNFHQFWLSHYSFSGQNTLSTWRGGPPRAKMMRTSPGDERQPAWYQNGVWISGEGPLQLAVRVDREADERATELIAQLDVEGEVLVISEETETVWKDVNGPKNLPRWPLVEEGDIGLFTPRRRFILVTSTGVQFVDLIYQERRAPQRRPPVTTRECARCLAMLKSDHNQDNPPRWMWSNPIKIEHGEQSNRWIQGLFLFLAVLLRSFWRDPIVKRRQGVDFFSCNLDAVEDILGHLQCIVVFIRQSQQGTAARDADAVAPFAAHRKLQYTTKISKKQAALQSANKLLGHVLDMMDRLIEVFVLLRVIHRDDRHNALQSTVFSDRPGKQALQRLRELRLCDVVHTHALQSFSMLCTAYMVANPNEDMYVVERGAPTICSLSERQRRPDLRQESSNEFYSRYLRMVDIGTADDQQINGAARSISKLVHTDPGRALDLCLEKVQQVLRKPANGEAVSRAKALFEAFLQTMENGDLNKALLDLTMTKLETLHRGENLLNVPFTYQAVFDFLLSHHRKQGPQLLVERYGLLVRPLCERYLEQRREYDPLAAEALWKFYLATHQYRMASRVLSQLADSTEGYGKNYTLAQRIKFLDLARHAAAKGLALEHSSSLQEAIIEMKHRLDIANRAQKPLVTELERLLKDRWVSKEIRSRANEELKRPELVLRPGGEIEVIREVADRLALPHITLCALDLFNGSPALATLDAVANAWIQVFWPVEGSPYLGPDMRSLVFPFLLSHPQPFLAPQEQTEEMPALAMKEFPNCVTTFVTELANNSDMGTTVWDPYVLGPILEFANVLFWTHERAENSKWVLELWQAPPFNVNTSTLLGLYSQMVKSSDSWVAELKSKIGIQHDTRKVTTEQVMVHLIEILLDIAQQWLSNHEQQRQNPQSMTAFRSGVKDMEAQFGLIESSLAPFPSHPRIDECLRITKELNENLKQLYLTH